VVIRWVPGTDACADVRRLRFHRGGVPDHAPWPDEPFLLLQLGGRAHELGVMEVAHFIWKKYGSSQRVLFVSVPFEEVLGEILGKSITVIWV
jgi:hypothetical protein